MKETEKANDKEEPEKEGNPTADGEEKRAIGDIKDGAKKVDFQFELLFIIFHFQTFLIFFSICLFVG